MACYENTLGRACDSILHVGSCLLFACHLGGIKADWEVESIKWLAVLQTHFSKPFFSNLTFPF